MSKAVTVKMCLSNEKQKNYTSSKCVKSSGSSKPNIKIDPRTVSLKPIERETLLSIKFMTGRPRFSFNQTKQQSVTLAKHSLPPYGDLSN